MILRIRDADGNVQEVVAIRGKNGKDGKDYVLTDADKEEIADMINTSGGVPQEVSDHIASKDNPHQVTAEQAGAAPTGYGLGENAIPTSWNGHYRNGFYRERKYSPTNPTSSTDTKYPYWYGVTCVESNSNSSGNQAQIAFNTDITNGLIEARRYKKGSTFGEWEYVNPPMLYGVEYRTTERWNGQPVYVSLFHFELGEGDFGSEILHNVCNVVDFRCVISDSIMAYVNDFQTFPANIGINEGALAVNIFEIPSGDLTADVLVKYTKIA